MHKSQIFFYCLSSFLLGVFVAPLFNISSSIILVLVILGLAVLVVGGYHKTFEKSKKAAEKRKFAIVLGFLILVFAFGAWRFNLFNLNNNILQYFAGKEAGGKGVKIEMNGYIDEEESISGNKANLVIRIKEVKAAGKEIRTDERILVTTLPYPNYNFGEKVSVNGSLTKPQNFNDFDYVTYLKKEGISFISSFPDITPYSDVSLSFYDKIKIGIFSYVFTIKNRFEDAINKSIPEPNASFINGILLGTRSNIPADLTEDFNRTGTTHIIAISGYNITIIGEAILALLVLLFRRKTAFWVSVVLILLFTVMTGLSASVVRAAIMGLLLMFASGYGRLYDIKNSIVFAGAVMVFVNPFLLNFDIGFQLSFLAVLGIVYLYPLLDKASDFFTADNLGIKEIALMTIAAQLAVLPLLLHYFKQLSLVSLFANVLVLPLMPFSMLFGFVAGLAGMVWISAGRLLGLVAFAITEYQIKVIEFLGGLKFSYFKVGAGWFAVIIMYLIILSVFYLMYRKQNLEKR